MNESLGCMPREYLALAEERVNANCRPHKQPEEFGYDFREWVSPYTKGAHRFGGLALVLQDWASLDKLAREPDCEIQYYGRAPRLRTNVRLEALLKRIFGTTLSEVYATNAFPFIKSGGMSSRLRRADVVQTVGRFTAQELKIANPHTVLALGALPYRGLTCAKVNCVRVSHPAARIEPLEKLEAGWRKALHAAGVRV